MRLIDADKLKDFWWEPGSGTEEWINELIYDFDLWDVDDSVRAFSRKMLDDVNNVIDTEPTVEAFEWITLADDTKLEDGLYLVTTTDGRVDIAEYSNEPKLYEWGKKGICIGCAGYWNIPDEILAVTPFESYTKGGEPE